jgi:uncharacterized protein (TIGR02594 family)
VSAPWLEVAVRELAAGVRELPGELHAARILEYWKSVEHFQPQDDETPWCSAFANWCMAQAWVVGTRRANARSWVGWGQEAALVPGAVVVLWRGSPQAATGHVAFYLGQSGGQLALLGGNQGDGVSVGLFPKGRLLAVRWPLGNHHG